MTIQRVHCAHIIISCRYIHYTIYIFTPTPAPFPPSTGGTGDRQNRSEVVGGRGSEASAYIARVKRPKQNPLLSLTRLPLPLYVSLCRRVFSVRISPPFFPSAVNRHARLPGSSTASYGYHCSIRRESWSSVVVRDETFNDNNHNRLLLQRARSQARHDGSFQRVRVADFSDISIITNIRSRH